MALIHAADLRRRLGGDHLVSPIDAIPDVIPVAGIVDDTGLALWMLAVLVKSAGDFVAWERGGRPTVLVGEPSLGQRSPGEPSHDVVITELRATTIAGLLEKLAARLSPGPPFGPGQNGEEMARIAADLAKELRDQTFLGQ
ncbi:uncharacterized protein DUF1232 [Actinomadura pelletieri DSM 43383]|uniref:Uncharacterized protein DUF1232 n=1 Tax=Actinomadura pelletieri DSM 43383 TaxID=1120940 RepID=A0A495QAD1_9ACTN|nr:YkvA family protein [Actinomadura pelletieri]RKS68425.1 uncharacterized protein DUF1232 [Actinomadura pelletieri DSM 43383]